jgi:hypothetical protein
MAKRIALKDYVGLDGHDISNFVRAVSFSSEHQRIDVSGFSSTGADEFLAGNTVQSVTLEVYGSYGTNEIHDIAYPIHYARAIVDFAWRPDQTAGVSAANPELGGNVQVLTYNPGATRGEAETFNLELTAADANGLVFSDT